MQLRAVDRLSAYSVFHFGYPPLTPRLQGAALAAMLAAVRKTGVLVSLDTTPVANDTTLRAMLREALPFVHLFAPNLEEASQLTGYFSRLAARAAEVSARSGQPTDFEEIISADELLAIGEGLLAYGIPLVIVTLGDQGALLCSGSEDALRALPQVPLADATWANQRRLIPAYEVHGALNTTGAGDTFIAGLLTGLTHGMGSLPEIVAFAQAAGALHIDAARGLCAVDDVRAAMRTLTRHLPSNMQLQLLLIQENENIHGLRSVE